MYKQCRPSQILQSEKRVFNVMEVLTEEYLDPFSIDLNKDTLVNLSSGVALPQNIADELLAIPEKGMELAKEFVADRLSTTAVLFHHKVPRKVNKSFISSKR